MAERLTQTLGAPAAHAEPGKRWRIALDVQRFDSLPGHEVRLEATWTISSVGEASAAPLRCRGEVVQAVTAGGYLALAKGHQQGVSRLADAVASSLKALNAGQTPTCQE